MSRLVNDRLDAYLKAETATGGFDWKSPEAQAIIVRIYLRTGMNQQQVAILLNTNIGRVNEALEAYGLRPKDQKP